MPENTFDVNYHIDLCDNLELESTIKSLYYGLPNTIYEQALDLWKNEQFLEAFELLPESHKSPSVYDEFVSRDYRILASVPDEFCGHDMCFYALLESPSAIELIPERFMSEEFFSSYFRENILRIAHIPAQACTLEMVIYGLECCDKNKLKKKNSDERKYLELIPDHLLVDALIHYCKNTSFDLLVHYPRALEVANENQLITILKATDLGLSAIPMDKRSYAVCSYCCRFKFDSIAHLPVSMMYEDLYWLAYSTYRCSFAEIPDSIKTKAFCLRVMSVDFKASKADKDYPFVIMGNDGRYHWRDEDNIGHEKGTLLSLMPREYLTEDFVAIAINSIDENIDLFFADRDMFTFPIEPLVNDITIINYISQFSSIESLPDSLQRPSAIYQLYCLMGRFDKKPHEYDKVKHISSENVLDDLLRYTIEEKEDLKAAHIFLNDSSLQGTPVYKKWEAMVM